MRRLTPILLWLGLVAACAPRLVPAPTITAPRYPDYIQPTLAPSFTGTRLAEHQDRAWRFLQTGDLRNAQREVETALRLEPRFTPAETTAGWVALARGDADGALGRFDGALARDHAYLPALVGRGHSLSELRRESDALAAYELALGVDPSLVDLRRRTDVLRFRVLQQRLASARDAVRQGRLDAAADAYSAALASSPDSAFLYRELGEVEQQRRNDATALAYFERAVELDPGDAVSLVRLGRLREAQGDLTGAIQAYERAAALDSSAGVRDALNDARARVEFSRLPEEYRTIEDAPAVTRAALAALIGIRLARLVEGAATTTPVVLTDVRSTWAEPWIMAVTQAGVMEGYANHTFQPDSSVPRIDLARAVTQLLPRVADAGALGAWQAARQSFSDLSTAHLAYPAASTAVASGVMSAAAGGRFEPSRPVTGREALAAVERREALARAAGAPTTRSR